MVELKIFSCTLQCSEAILQGRNIQELEAQNTEENSCNPGSLQFCAFNSCISYGLNWCLSYIFDGQVVSVLIVNVQRILFGSDALASSDMMFASNVSHATVVVYLYSDLFVSV